MNAMNKVMIQDDQTTTTPAATRNGLYVEIKDHSTVFRNIASTLTVVLESEMDKDVKNDALDLMMSVLRDTNNKLNGLVDRLFATEAAQ